LRPIAIYRKADLASVHVLSAGEGPDGAPRRIEAVESVQPPIPRDRKWVLIVSTLVGCPVGCVMCDAGREWRGRLGTREILAQIDYLIAERYPDRRLPQDKLKIQFARMGEPALNPAVLQVLRQLPTRYDAPGLLPSLSSIAPRGTDGFFEELLAIKDELYAGGRFQLQFSVHSTDDGVRARIVPVKTWSLEEMARYGSRFHGPGDRKVTLNFAACRDHPIDPVRIAERFDPSCFLIKLTPLNPTLQVRRTGLRSWIDPDAAGSGRALARSFEERGFEVILSVGEAEENAIGSNCGQYVSRTLTGDHAVRDGYRSPEYAERPVL